MFEPRIITPTDLDLLEILATRGMGWELHEQSGHRPGSRDVPHVWRFRRDKVRLMVYLGGDGAEANVEFNPLEHAEAAAELVRRLAVMGINVEGWDLATEEGRRATCEAAGEKLRALPPPAPPPPPEPALSSSAPAKLTHAGGSFPNAEFVAGESAAAAIAKMAEKSIEQAGNQPATATGTAKPAFG